MKQQQMEIQDQNRIDFVHATDQGTTPNMVNTD